MSDDLDLSEFAGAQAQIKPTLFERVGYFACALFVTSMVIWMWRTSRTLKRGIETKVESIASGRTGAVIAGLFALTFVLILREGVETALFLAAVELTSDALLSFAGGLLGLALAVGFGIALVRGSVRVDIGRFFKVTEVVLILLAVQLLIGGLHEFGEAGTIPITREQMRLIGPIVKSDVIVMAAMLALPLIVLVIPGRRHRTRLQEAMGLEGPDRRLAISGIRRDTLWRRLAAIAGVLVIVPLTLSFAFSRLPDSIEPPTLIEASEGGEVRLPVAGLDDGRLHRFGNGMLTKASNLLTGLKLTDMETCYKAFRRDALRGLEIRQHRFGFEPEVTAKLARRGCRFQEIPIRYNARGYEDGKKIGMRDAVNALYCIVRYGMWD